MSMKKKIALWIVTLTGGLLVLPLLAKESEALLESYEEVSTALANGDLAAAQEAAVRLADAAAQAEQTKVAEHASKLARSESLDDAREHMKALSAEAKQLAEGQDAYHVMTCPMAKADWVQSGEQKMNPYMGKMMQQCGQMMEEHAASMRDCCR